MSMQWCPNCGTGHECEAQASGPSPDVEIARINARRDVEVARLTAGIERAANDTELAVAEVEAESGVAEAEAVADALTEVLAPPEPPPAPDPAPVVIEDTQDEMPAGAPPPRDEREHSSGDRAPAVKRGFF